MESYSGGYYQELEKAIKEMDEAMANSIHAISKLSTALTTHQVAQKVANMSMLEQQLYRFEKDAALRDRKFRKDMAAIDANALLCFFFMFVVAGGLFMFLHIRTNVPILLFFAGTMMVGAFLDALFLEPAIRRLEVLKSENIQKNIGVRN
jgi:hypothetical protein